MRGKKTGGRVRGIPNRLTKSAREAFQLAFTESGGAAGLTAWAKANPGPFYTLYARLIPVEHTGDGGEAPITTVVRHFYETLPPASLPPAPK
jgi:hypothetical protein